MCNLYNDSLESSNRFQKTKEKLNVSMLVVISRVELLAQKPPGQMCTALYARLRAIYRYTLGIRSNSTVKAVNMSLSFAKFVRMVR